MKTKTQIKTRRAAARHPSATRRSAGVSGPAAPMPPPTRTPQPQQPHYGDGTHYDSGARYAVGVDEPPEPQGAKVKLDLRTRPDPALAQFSLDHIAAMTGNANFPTPTPTAPDFLAALTAFQTAYSAAETAKAAAKQAVAEKDEARAYLELLLTQRGNYVQIASYGNAPVILSAAFPVANPRTPVGELAPPVNLLLVLNGTPGVMHLSWAGVPYARSYVIQCSPANTMEREWTPFKMSTMTKLKIDGLTLGQVYAFRIAAVGGITGQSDWSAEVVRMAA